MPELHPFAGLRPNPSAGSLEDFVCPPYDVISEPQRAKLLSRSPHNFVRVELPAGDYSGAAALLCQWREEGVLLRDAAPALYAYRMTYNLPGGASRTTTGVIGAVVLEPPGKGILPHEQTTPKAKSDRLELLRAVRANTSPIWCLCAETGLTQALGEPPAAAGRAVGNTAGVEAGPGQAGPARVASARDADGNLHELWPIFSPEVHEAVSKIIAAAPLLVADGHHRYETALAYQAEQEGAGGTGLRGHDAVMALVVELSERDLTVLAIHRVVSGLPPGADVLDAFQDQFEIVPATARGDGLLPEMADVGALGVLTRAGAFLAKPRQGAPSAAYELDSSRADAALAGLASHKLTYEHDVSEAFRAVASGAADGAVFCRPARVDQIARTAHGGDRMPPKTTFFWPKPLSGMVVRDW